MALIDTNKLEIIILPSDDNHSERMGYKGIDLFPMQEQMLEQIVEDFNNQQEMQIVSQEIEPVEHSLPDDIVFHVLPDVDLTQGIDLEAELTPVSSQEQFFPTREGITVLGPDVPNQPLLGWPIHVSNEPLEEIEVLGHTSSEVMDAGVIYAPYIPLYQTPTLNLSDLNIPGPILNNDLGEEIFVIKKYNDIYSDISKRFEILDL